jgi:hypothetical protein
VRRALRNHRRTLVGVGLAAVPLLAGLAILVFGWDEGLRLVQMAMAILGSLLALKAAIVFITVGIRLLL